MNTIIDVISDVVGAPATEWQANALYVGGLVLLVLSLWAIFKLVNYLFHI